MKKPRVAVIGAGIIGLTSAVVLQEQIPDLPITIISEKFSPHTTGDGSAGLWEPYLAGNTDILLLRKWSHATYNKFQELWRSKEGPRIGLTLLPIMCLSSKNFNKEADILHEGTFGYKILHEKMLVRLSKEHGNNYRSGYEFVTFTCEASKFLPHLMAEFLKQGGKVEHRKVEALQELAEEGYDVVVNCSGLQARELVPDEAVFPVRGQMVMVEAPWQRECILYLSDDSAAVIIPNQDYVCLGGTSQRSYNTQVDPSDRDDILNKCCKLSPDLKNAKILKEWVGLRPGRTCVRLGLGDSIASSGGRSTIVVHNYGHGGSGITLSWGCAHEVVKILQNALPVDSL